MVRQARSEVTRRRIIDSAVDLFSENGYPATGLGDIIERAEMTKGAFYYHFDSKEALASTIIEEAGASLLRAFRSIGDSSPALESMIHGVFVTVDHIGVDKVARIGTQLLRVFGGFNAAAARTYTGWRKEMIARARQVSAEGDLRTDTDPEVVAEVIVGALLGAELLSHATSGGKDLRQRIAHTWGLLLPAIVTDESLGYFREFLSRESLRPPSTPSAE
jgi:AcrR family transcriptional regulator